MAAVGAGSSRLAKNPPSPFENLPSTKLRTGRANGEELETIEYFPFVLRLVEA